MISPVFISQVAAQVAQVPPDPASGLYVYGPLGIVCAFFMWVSVKVVTIAAEYVKTTKSDNELLRNEVKQSVVESGAKIEHKITGLSRTILIDLLERKDLSEQGRRLAQVEFEKTNAPFTRQ